MTLSFPAVPIFAPNKSPFPPFSRRRELIFENGVVAVSAFSLEVYAGPPEPRAVLAPCPNTGRGRYAMADRGC